MDHSKGTNAERHTDICSDIREVSTRVKNTPLTIFRHQTCFPNVFFSTRRHDVLQITLRNKEVYALDMTGAQYGWPVPAAMSWDTFMEERVEIIKENRKFGETAQALQVEEAAAATSDRDARRHYQVMDEMKQCFNILFKKWQYRQGNNFSLLKDMLRLPEEEFKRKQASLFEFMNERMTALSFEFCKATATAKAIKRKTQASSNVSPTT